MVVIRKIEVPSDPRLDPNATISYNLQCVLPYIVLPFNSSTSTRVPLSRLCEREVGMSASCALRQCVSVAGWSFAAICYCCVCSRRRRHCRHRHRCVRRCAAGSDRDVDQRTGHRRRQSRSLHRRTRRLSISAARPWHLQCQSCPPGLQAIHAGRHHRELRSDVARGRAARDRHDGGRALSSAAKRRCSIRRRR